MSTYFTCSFGHKSDASFDYLSVTGEPFVVPNGMVLEFTSDLTPSSLAYCNSGGGDNTRVLQSMIIRVITSFKV